MTPAEIMAGMAEKNRQLSMKNDEYVKLVEKRAQAERAYNMGAADKTMRLKADGNSITLISTLVKGDETVSRLKLDFDIALGIERACLESIKGIRSAIDTYRSLLAWLKAEMQSQ